MRAGFRWWPRSTTTHWCVHREGSEFTGLNPTCAGLLTPHAARGASCNRPFTRKRQSGQWPPQYRRRASCSAWLRWPAGRRRRSFRRRRRQWARPGGFRSGKRILSNVSRKRELFSTTWICSSLHHDRSRTNSSGLVSIHRRFAYPTTASSRWCRSIAGPGKRAFASASSARLSGTRAHTFC